ncbi:hypothetical protein BCR44DRAFT_40516 [Catenaria anguillulae PL171]|uniref:Uncharacterized protein n=1 Tax=Catenaria anguillulae PL171 TaxID=765915 RepID=A0A1Y2HZ87_9FUNG|nr:hypothetical protein BCR44DRAFT_40516 [Catenaria anguillulae PL171]
MNAASLLIALAALIAVVAAREWPFVLPAAYNIETGTGHRVIFREDGRFTFTTNVRCIRAPCPMSGGEGAWAFDAKLRELTLLQEVEGGNVVTQTWRMGAATKDHLSLQWRGNRLVFRRGAGSETFPLPQGAGNWNRDMDFEPKN